MASNTLEVSLALKSSGFKSEINNIKKENQLLRAEFDKLSSSVDDFEDTLEGKQAKLKLVTKEYENAKKQVEIYKKQVELAKNAVEESNAELKRQQSVIDSTRAYINKYKDATGDVAKTVQEAEARLVELEKEFQKQAKAVVSANTQYQNMKINLSKAEKSVNELGKELGNCANDVYSFDKKLDGLEGQLKDVDSQLDQVGKSALDFSAKMSEVGQGLANVGNALTDLGKKGLSAIGSLVSKGSEWNAQVAGQEFVYNTLDEAIQKVIDSSSEEAKKIGLTTQQYKNSATTMAAYYKNMGMTTEQTSDLVGETMNLVADLAAVNDIPFDDALSRFKSGLQGNYEALDAFGVNLSASMLENSEFVKSLGKSWNKLSDNEKMMAAYNEIVRQGAFATGLAEQESDSFGMQMKLLKQQVEEASGEIGENLLPTLEPFIKMASDIVEKLVEWSEAHPELMTNILLIVGSISGLLAVLGPIVSLLGNGVILFGALAPAIESAGGVMAFLSQSILPVIGVIGALVGIAFILYKSIEANWEGIQEATNNLIETCRPYFEQLGEAFKELWRVCQEIYEVVVKPLFEIIGQLIENVINFCTPFFVIFAQFFTDAINIIVSIWDNIGKPLFEALMFIVQSAFDFVSPIFNLIAEVFSAMVESIMLVFDNVLKPMFDLFMETIGELFDKVSPAFEGIKNSIVGALEKVNEAIDGAIRWVKDLMDSIGNALGKVGEFMSSLNPFKSKSIDVDATMKANIPGMASIDAQINPIGEVALSGSYYTRNTPLSEGMAKLGSVASGLNSTNSTSAIYNQDTTKIESILETYLGQFVQAIASFNPTIEVGLNGRKLSEELNIINGQGMKLNERWR